LIQAVEANVEGEGADGDLLGGLDGADFEGAAGKFDVEPGEEDSDQAILLYREVSEIPRAFGTDAVRKRGVDAIAEDLDAVVGGEVAEVVLGFDALPEVLESFVEERAGFAGVEAKFGGVELGGSEAELGEGEEAAGGLELEDGGAAGDFGGWDCGEDGVVFVGFEGYGRG
jgi:hypothetical protein